MIKKLVHFLIVFDHSSGGLLKLDEFDDARRASDAYTAAEDRYENVKHLEIVLVASDSEDTIRKTHANYFDGLPLSASQFVVGIEAVRA